MLVICLPIVLIFTRCEKEPEPKLSIPDNNFLNALIEQGVDTDGDGKISQDEAEAIIKLTFWGAEYIADMTGIQSFINLDTLVVIGTKINSLDLSDMIALRSLKLGWNQHLISLDLSNCTSLSYLYSYMDVLLNTLDLSTCVSLEELEWLSENLTYLDVSNNTKLKHLECYGSHLTDLDVSTCTELTELLCSRNLLTTLDLSNNAKLEALVCRGNYLSELNVSHCKDFAILDFSENKLTTIDVTKNRSLQYLDCGYNNITSLELSNNTELFYLNCRANHLATLDLSNNTKLGLTPWEKFYPHLDLTMMPTLHKVCVWSDPFPPDYLIMYTDGSPNVFFTTNCIAK